MCIYFKGTPFKFHNTHLFFLTRYYSFLYERCFLREKLLSTKKESFTSEMSFIQRDMYFYDRKRLYDQPTFLMHNFFAN